MTDRELHHQLEDLAARLGIRVVTAVLQDEEFRVESGSCRVRDRRVVILDRRISPARKNQVLIAEIRTHNLDGIFIPPFLRAVLEGERATPDASGTPLKIVP